MTLVTVLKVTSDPIATKQVKILPKLVDRITVPTAVAVETPQIPQLSTSVKCVLMGNVCFSSELAMPSTWMTVRLQHRTFTALAIRVKNATPIVYSATVLRPTTVFRAVDLQLSKQTKRVCASTRGGKEVWWTIPVTVQKGSLVRAATTTVPSLQS